MISSLNLLQIQLSQILIHSVRKNINSFKYLWCNMSHSQFLPRKKNIKDNNITDNMPFSRNKKR